MCLTCSSLGRQRAGTLIVNLDRPECERQFKDLRPTGNKQHSHTHTQTALCVCVSVCVNEGVSVKRSEREKTFKVCVCVCFGLDTCTYVIVLIWFDLNMVLHVCTNAIFRIGKYLVLLNEGKRIALLESDACNHLEKKKKYIDTFQKYSQCIIQDGSKNNPLLLYAM